MSAADAAPAPLAGLRVLELSQFVMGPSGGVVLADLGAEVIKIEPVPDGDGTRQLAGFGAGFYGFYNRNKKSLALDLKNPAGLSVMHRLVASADVLLENYAPGTMERLGCGYEALAAINSRLVYCALKGYLSGPDADRPALDEVTQYRAGLAYMTGPPGRPLRAGTSIVDIMGGVFGVVAILAALREREQTGRGQLVKSALFESTVFLMGQHMAASAILGVPVPPMPARLSVWGIYQTFRTADDAQVFVGVTGDAQWERFCEVFERPDLLADPRLRTNRQRAEAHEWFIPIIADWLAHYTKAELIGRCERARIPVAPTATVEDLFQDPHLVGGGGLLELAMGTEGTACLPRLPLELDGGKPGLAQPAPRLGEHSRAVLADAGLSAAEIEALLRDGVVVAA